MASLLTSSGISGSSSFPQMVPQRCPAVFRPSLWRNTPSPPRNQWKSNRSAFLLNPEREHMLFIRIQHRVSQSSAAASEGPLQPLCSIQAASWPSQSWMTQVHPAQHELRHSPESPGYDVTNRSMKRKTLSNQQQLFHNRPFFSRHLSSGERWGSAGSTLTFRHRQMLQIRVSFTQHKRSGPVCGDV